MEVIRNADVARLVLGYLRDQNLEKASNIFCKTSPYLEDEYRLIQKGLRPAIKLGSGQLVAIIKEHCEISAKMDQLVDSLPSNITASFPKHLSSRISYISKIVKKHFGIKEKAPPKRRRSIDSVDTRLETTSVQDLPGYSPSISKRRRMSGSSYLIVNTQSHANSDAENLTDEENISGSCSSSEPDTVLNHPNSSKSNVTQSPKEKSLTSNDTSAEMIEVPSFSTISETLLENTEFQTKLAGYINKALQDSSVPPSAEKNPEGLNKSEIPLNTTNDIIHEQLDDAIKNILAAIDNDPISNQVIEDIIISPANKSISTNKGTQMTPFKDEDKVGDKVLSSNKKEQPKVDIEITTVKQVESINKTVNFDKGTQMTPSREDNDAGNDETNYTTATDGGSSTGIKIIATSSVVLPTNQNPIYQKTIGETSINTTATTTTNSLSNSNFKTPIVDSSGGVAKFFIVNSKDGTETPLIGNPMLSNTSSSNVQGYSPFSDQILMDLSTGQISIPLYMANESLNFPMIINNSVAQQLQEGNINLENTRIEIPVTIEAVPNSPDGQQSGDGNEVIEITTADGLKLFQGTAIVQNNPPSSLPTLLEPRSDDKSTPSSNMIVQSNKSLSTPRRRQSHVRVLNFATPSKMLSGEQRNEPVISGEVVLDQGGNIAKNVENVLIQTNILKSPILNDGSNSNSLDIAMDKSNDTVIHKTESETPRRKPTGFGCVRNISRSNSLEDENQDKKPEDDNVKKLNECKTVKKSLIPRMSSVKSDKTQEPKPSTENAVPIDDWQRYRSMNRSNFDQYLREVCSSSGLANTITRRRKRKKNLKKLTDSQTKGDKSTTKKTPAKQSCHEGDSSKNASTESLEPKHAITKKEICNVEMASNKKNLQVKEVTSQLKVKIEQVKEKSSEIKEKSSKIKEKSSQIREKSSQIKDKSSQKIKKETEKSKSKPSASKQKSVNVHASAEKQKDNFTDFKNPPKSSASVKKVKISKEALERELQKRTADIGCLLQTPFKEDLPNIPPTPKFITPIETPISKMMNSLRPTSDIKNLEVPTPSYAITPGANLITTDKDTPRSGMWSSHPTDYSSGGSYYKPDESEDLDRHLDRLLTTQRQSRRIEQTSKDSSSLPNSSLELSSGKDKEKKDSSAVSEEVKVECPVVLERVKSFTEEIPQVVPHYTFVAKDLPEDESSDSDSSSSSSSSNSSSNSSSSSASSKSKLSLSDIDSSEDEEWKQQSVEANNPNLLIAEDGEVRYPVRSWITPKKNDSSGGKKSQSAKSHTKTAKRLSDLEAKRLRVKEKLKGDLQTGNVKVIKKPPATVSRKIIKQKSVTTNKVASVVEDSEPPIVVQDNEQDKQINMLKALNLSKKVVTASSSKTLPKETSRKSAKVTENLIHKIETISKTFIREESRESCESEQIRNAAMVLTNMQKRAKYIDPIKMPDLNKKKGRPSKKDSSPVAIKVPRTLQMSLRNKKSKIAANTRSSKNTKKGNDNSKKLTPIKKPPAAIKRKVAASKAVKATKKIIAPPIQISEIRSSVDDCESVKKVICDRSDSSRVKEESPIVSSNTAPEEDKNSSSDDKDDDDDDEDPYDLCEIETVDENDVVHYRHYIYDGPCTDTTSYAPPAFESIENLSSSVMNIFLDNKQHILKVHDEVELFSIVPKIKTKIIDGKKPIKNVPKKRQRKAHIEPSSSSKKDSPTECHQSMHEQNIIPLHSSTPVQSTLRANPRVLEDMQDADRTGIVSEQPNDNDIYGATTAAASECPTNTAADAAAAAYAESHSQTIKPEDIYAVLSHLHGDDEKVD